MNLYFIIITLDKIITNENLSINNGAIALVSNQKSDWILNQLDLIGKKFNFTLFYKTIFI